MTITSNVTRNSYTGTGITGPYPVTFKFFEDADLKVTVADTNGVETVKTLTTDYTVTGAGEQAGGSITFTTAVTTGYSIVIEPKADQTQDTDIKNEGGNLREAIEDRFDRLCRDDQVQQNLIDRSVKMQTTDADDVDGVLPPREGGALIGWNDSGTGFANRAASLFASDAAITSTGSNTARWISDRFAEVVNVRDFGAVGDGVTDDSSAIKAAISYASAGSLVVIPVSSSSYLINTSGGLTDAIEVDKQVTIKIDGHVKSSFGAIQANPPYIFNVTAEGVSFVGNGTIEGDGSVDDTNSGTDDTMPGLIRIAADNCRVSRLRVITPPKLGVMLYGCYNCVIDDVLFTGGPTSYTTGNTGYFAIRMYQGGRHLITRNRFVPADDGGMFVNCMFSVSSHQNIVSNNVAHHPYEKLVYLYGDSNLVTGNTVRGNQSTIAGTSQAGTITSVYRVNGTSNKIVGNYSDYCLAGATAMDGLGNEIAGNTFLRCGQAAIVVFNSSTGAISNCIVRDNIATYQSITGITRSDGVYLRSQYASSSNIVVSGNWISGFATTGTEAQINVIADSPYSIDTAIISGNHVSGGTNGVRLDRVVSSVISGNYVNTASANGLVESGGAYNKWSSNRTKSAGVGISGLSALSDGSGNQYTDVSLTGTMTCAAAVTTTVTHGGVAANARVFLQTANDGAGVMIVAKGWPTTSVATNDFTVRMANGTAAAGTESFFYNIIQ